MSISAGEYGPDDKYPMELRVLGSVQVRRDGEWIPAPTRQVARVATMLAGWPGKPIERDRIIAAIWGDQTPTTATNTLQVHVSHLRRLLGKHSVRSKGTNYILDVPPEAIDAEQFCERIAEATRMRRRQHYGRAAEWLTSAIDLWRGTPFPDVRDPDLEARRARLTELYDLAREDMLECKLELARDRYELAEVIADAKELVTRQPMRERGHSLLVRALAAADRGSEASAAFEAAAERLRTTMGLDPGRELVTIHAMSLNHDPALLPAAMSALDALPPARRANDATQAMANRVREAVVDLGATVVTVTEEDPKARYALALAVGEALRSDMPGGVILAKEPALPALDAMLIALTQARVISLAEWPKRASLAVIVDTDDVADATVLCQEFTKWLKAPVLVVLSSTTMNTPTEVVIGMRTASTRACAARQR